MKQKTKLVSAAEYARLRNLTPSLIYRQIRKGIIRTHDGKINVAAADTDRAHVLDPGRVLGATLRKQPCGADDAEVLPDQLDYHKSRAAQAYWDACNKKLAFKKAEGEVILYSDAIGAFGKIISEARSQFLLMPDKLAAKLAATNDPRECAILLMGEVKRTLQAMTDSLAGAGERLKNAAKV